MGDELMVEQSRGRCRKRPAIIGRDDREQGFVEQLDGAEAGPAAGPVAQADIDLPLADRGQRPVGAEVDLDLGWRSWKRLSRGIRNRVAKPGKTEMTSFERSIQGLVSNASLSSPMPSRTRPARTRPGSVSDTPRPWRSNNSLPSRSSRLRMAWLMAPWVRLSSSAALAKL